MAITIEAENNDIAHDADPSQPEIKTKETKQKRELISNILVPLKTDFFIDFNGEQINVDFH